MPELWQSLVVTAHRHRADLSLLLLLQVLQKLNSEVVTSDLCKLLNPGLNAYILQQIGHIGDTIKALLMLLEL